MFFLLLLDKGGRDELEERGRCFSGSVRSGGSGGSERVMRGQFLIWCTHFRGDGL